MLYKWLTQKELRVEHKKKEVKIKEVKAPPTEEETPE